MTLIYAVFSLLGFLGLGSSPIAKLARVNMISVICAVFGIMGIISGGLNLPLVILTALHLFDAYKGTKENGRESKKTKNSFDNEEYSRINNMERRSENGPVMTFFTESWRVNSFNRLDNELN